MGLLSHKGRGTPQKRPFSVAPKPAQPVAPAQQKAQAPSLKGVPMLKPKGR